MYPLLIFIPIALLLFVVFVVWLGVCVFRLNGVAKHVEEMASDLNRLDDRVTLLEKLCARQNVAPAQPRTEITPPAPAPAAQTRTVSATPVATALVASPVGPAAPMGPVTASVSAMKPIAVIAPPAIAPPLRSASVPFAERAPQPPAPKPRVSLEERLGQNWLNKLGIITLVTGLALFLGYQIRNLGPLGKSALGLLLSLALLVAGLLLERREKYRIFARAAIGGGWALLYFVSFALFHIPAMQVLRSQAADLVLMLIVATGMIVHSLRYRSQVVTSLAFLLASFTITISQVTVFSLVAGAILAVGLVSVAFRQRWFLMMLGGLATVYLNHFLWLQHVLPDGARPEHPFAEFLPSAALLLFYWLLFRIFYIFCVPESDLELNCSALNVTFNSIGLLALLKYQSAHPEWAFYGLSALGALELVLAFVARRRHRNAFVALSCIASLFLLAAVPFRFAGTGWSLLWLLQAEMLFVAGIALKEKVFRRLGVISSFAAVAHLLVTGALPVLEQRQISAGASHHGALTLAFVCAAIMAWFNGEFAIRRWPQMMEEAFDLGALAVLSYTAALCAGVAVWISFPGIWTLLPWLVLALALAFISGRIRSEDLAQQADLLSIASAVRIITVNLAQWNQSSHTPRMLILLGAVAMLYALARRRQAPRLLPMEVVEPCYSWAAAMVLSVLAWFVFEPAAISVAWCLLGMVLLEIGLAARKPFIRDQGYLLLGASFVRLYFANIGLASGPRIYTMLPLAAMYAWAYQRLHANEQTSRTDKTCGAFNAWFAMGTIATLLYFSLRPAWVAIGEAMLAVAALLLSRMLRRHLFSVQAFVLLLFTAARTIAFNIFSTSPIARTFTEGTAFTVLSVCVLLLGALPLTFSIRRQQQPTADEPIWTKLILRRPEQVLFFTPLAVLFMLILVHLRAGMITIGWSALGLITFLFALTIRERSFRLTGLGLLLLGVGKIVLVDIWKAAPTDRYITLIVMGAALLLVSFLYSRYRETILKLL